MTTFGDEVCRTLCLVLSFCLLWTDLVTASKVRDCSGGSSRKGSLLVNWKYSHEETELCQ